MYLQDCGSGLVCVGMSCAPWCDLFDDMCSGFTVCTMFPNLMPMYDGMSYGSCM